MSVYIGVDFEFKDGLSISEMLIAELGALGFESFVEKPGGLEAYIQKPEWSSNLLDSVFVLNSDQFQIDYNVKEIEQVNWNSEWEKHFDPIQVNDRVSIRAPFHENPNLDYDIIIEPKMSFGTGHHETTHLMVSYLLEMDLTGEKVLDMGCGTGILAIFAEMRGASSVDAIDIDNWCYINTLENIERNKIKHVKAYEGDASLLVDQSYDIVIANINRNILLADIPVYCERLMSGGTLLLSGFYSEDVSLIEARCSEFGMKLEEQKERHNWMGLKFVKK
ncbi:MAG: 50S ribosomal protein L11 methyltransferase [Flavobacteriaceae bacterium]